MTRRVFLQNWIKHGRALCTVDRLERSLALFRWELLFALVGLTVSLANESKSYKLRLLQRRRVGVSGARRREVYILLWTLSNISLYLQRVTKAGTPIFLKTKVAPMQNGYTCVSESLADFGADAALLGLRTSGCVRDRRGLHTKADGGQGHMFLL